MEEAHTLCYIPQRDLSFFFQAQDSQPFSLPPKCSPFE